MDFKNVTFCALWHEHDKQYLPMLIHSIAPYVGSKLLLCETKQNMVESLTVIKETAEMAQLQYTYTGALNFARAKNAVLERVRTEWICFLDADERLVSDVSALQEATRNECSDGVFCSVVSAQPFDAGGKAKVDISKQIRLFRLSDDIRFEGEIHEQVTQSIERHNGTVNDSHIVINHVGYLDSQKNYGKIIRNIRGLAAMVASGNNTAYNYAMLRAELNKLDAAGVLDNAIEGITSWH